MPALVGHAPLMEGIVHFLFGPMVGSIGRREDTFDALANHFFRAPPHHPLGLRIPVGNDAGRVGQDNGQLIEVVEHRKSACVATDTRARAGRSFSGRSLHVRQSARTCRVGHHYSSRLMEIGPRLFFCAGSCLFEQRAQALYLCLKRLSGMVFQAIPISLMTTAATLRDLLTRRPVRIIQPSLDTSTYPGSGEVSPNARAAARQALLHPPPLHRTRSHLQLGIVPQQR